MNERIRELADEATRKYDRLGNDIPFAQPDLEKFAQLIVYECMDLALGSSHREDDMGAIIANKIKQHFGVEDRAVPILSADDQALFAGIASSKLFTIAGAKKQFGVEE